MNELIQKVRWYITIRWYFLSVLALTGIVPQMLNEGITSRVIRNIIGACIVLGMNGLLMIIIRLQTVKHAIMKLVLMQLGIDLLLATYVTYIQGAVESRTIILYTIPILVAGALIGKKAIYATAAVSAIFYSTVLSLDYADILPSIVRQAPDLHNNLAYVVNSIIFYSAVFFIIGWIADFVLTLLEKHQATIAAQASILAEAQRVAKLGNWQYDTKTGLITWSDELYELHGVSRENFDPNEPGAITKLIHHEDRRLIDAAFMKISGTKEPLSFNYRVVLPKRKVHSFHLSCRPSEHFQHLIVGITQDITELRHIEQRAEQRTQELESLNRALIGRELKMIELKQRIKELEDAHAAS